MNCKSYIQKAGRDQYETDGLDDQGVEQHFWDNLHKKSPLYGCDIKGSLFSENNPSQWNLRHLPSCLNDGLGKTVLEGINSPYLYYGNFRSMFAWHVEDFNLASLNYQHYGKPKYWYSISRRVI